MRFKFIIIALLFVFGVNNPTVKQLYIHNSLISKLYFRLFQSSSKENICKGLQNELLRDISQDTKYISISIMNKKGELIADINGSTPRIPASNQKLITTAYTLDQLGPHYRLKTILYKNIRTNSYHLVGSGDPDLNILHINKFVDSIVSQTKSSNNQPIQIYLYDQPNNNWWPSSWSKYDRKKTYGAPISMLAMQSNSQKKALSNPLNYFKSILKDRLLDKGLYSHNIYLLNVNHISTNLLQPISVVQSSPVYGLISLANSESHNFTSEVLFRNAFRNWNISNLNQGVSSWLRFKNVDPNKFYLADSSGLSKENKLTTYGLVNFLYKMSHHRYSKYYFSSMALYGARGTLSERPYRSNLTGKLLAKTGTLENVKSLSGVLNAGYSPLYISIIINKPGEHEDLIDNLLSTISSSSNCN